MPNLPDHPGQAQEFRSVSRSRKTRRLVVVHVQPSVIERRRGLVPFPPPARGGRIPFPCPPPCESHRRRAAWHLRPNIPKASSCRRGGSRDLRSRRSRKMKNIFLHKHSLSPPPPAESRPCPSLANERNTRGLRSVRPTQSDRPKRSSRGSEAQANRREGFSACVTIHEEEGVAQGRTRLGRSVVDAVRECG